MRRLVYASREPIIRSGAALTVTLGTRVADHIGRDDQRSSDTGLAFVVSRWLGRSVGAWDPA